MASKNKELFIVVQVESYEDDLDPDYFNVIDYNDAVYSSLKEAEQAALDAAEDDAGTAWYVARLVSKTEAELKVVKVA